MTVYICGKSTHIDKEDLKTTLTTTGVLPSDPPSGKCLVTNLYVDPSTGRLTVEYEEEPIT